MADASEILKDPEIASFLETHQGAAERVRAAERQLRAKPDALAAMKKLLPALTNEKIQVFFSYKKKDEEAAKAVIKTLRERAARKLEITYQAEFTKAIAGKNWRDWIRESIRPANWFILLLPDPSDDWDWCLFETGVFVANRCSADRLICLHHPDTGIPPQIDEYHAVAATEQDVEDFLRLVYLEEDPVPGMAPINPDVEEHLPKIARDIVHAIRPPQKILTREVYEPWVELRIHQPADLSNKEDLDQAVVAGANQAALDLFGFLKPPKSWGELRSDVLEADGDGRWRFELFHVLRRIARDRQFHPIQAVFKLNSGKMYRPVACAVDRLGPDGPIDTFHVTFAEDVSALDSVAMPRDIAMLANLLRFTFRFRWEVLERFSEGPLTDDDVERLDNTLRRIKKDWESRHVGDVMEIFRVFADDDRRRFEEMTASWHQIMNDEKTGKLDVAIRDRDTETIPGLLAGFLPMNQEFLEVAAERFSDLVAGRSEPVPPTQPAAASDLAATH